MKIKTIKVALMISLGLIPSMLKAQGSTNIIYFDTDGSHQGSEGLFINGGVAPGRSITTFRSFTTGNISEVDFTAKKRLFVRGNSEFSRTAYFDDGINVRSGNSAFSKIGIGVTPQEGIHVKNKNIRVDGGEYQSYGTVILHPDVDNTGDDRISFRNSINREMASLQDGSLFLRSFNSTTGGIIESNGPLRLRPGNDNTGDDVISFRNGTNEEMARLQDGILTLDQIRLNVTTFPDYVFAADYKLMPLEEVASYIAKNKHLPNMPTEAKVVKEGMNVGQINTILVEKVEELTLYILQLKEQLDIQNKKIENLNK